jgi:hypothetical protein
MTIISRIEINGVPVPVKMSLAESHTEREAQAWQMFEKQLAENIPMNFGLSNNPGSSWPRIEDKIQGARV